jgi:hypothetical protein
VQLGSYFEIYKISKLSFYIEKKESQMFNQKKKEEEKKLINRILKYDLYVDFRNQR